jgi:hypothetical protein
MAKTVLQIGNAAASACGLPQQTNLVGNANQNALRILQSVKDAAGRDVFRGYDWANLQYEHTFVTTGATSYAELPVDFDRIINGTIWDRTNERPVYGPVTAQKWQRYESGLDGLTGLTLLFRIVGNELGSKVIKIYPDTSTGVTIAFEYISNKYVAGPSGPSTGFLKAEVDDDGDTFLFDDDLVEVGATWRLLRNLGLSYADEKIEFESLMDERSANDGGAGSLSMMLRSTWQIRDPNIPDTGYGGV